MVSFENFEGEREGLGEEAQGRRARERAGEKVDAPARGCPRFVR